MSNFLFSSFIFFCSDVSGSSDEETRIALWARWQIKHQEFMAWIPWLLQDFVWWGSWAGWPHQHAGDELLVGSLRIVVTPLSVVCAHHGTLTVLQRPHTQRSAHIWYASCHRQWFQGANLGGSLRMVTLMWVGIWGGALTRSVWSPKRPSPHTGNLRHLLTAVLTFTSALSMQTAIYAFSTSFHFSSQWYLVIQIENQANEWLL